MQNADQHDAEIENLLHGVVMRQIVVAQAKPQCVADRRQNLADRDRKQLSPKASGRDSVAEISEPVEHEDPHAEEVPLQAVLRPFADHEAVGKMQKAEDHVVVIDFPAAADHDENGDGIDPMHDAKRQRMQAVLFVRG